MQLIEKADEWRVQDDTGMHTFKTKAEAEEYMKAKGHKEEKKEEPKIPDLTIDHRANFSATKKAHAIMNFLIETPKLFSGSTSSFRPRLTIENRTSPNSSSM